LRDVAGMMRSFGYAAALAFLDDDTTGDGDPTTASSLDLREPQLLAESWEQRACEAFVTEYAATDGIDELLPRTAGSRDALLRVFELDKSLYELAYELAHRPRYAAIPRQAVTRLTTADHHRRW
jgi:predicted trehalose synthase